MSTSGTRIEVSCSPEFKASSQAAAREFGDGNVAEYVRDAIRLRNYLEHNGYTKRSLDQVRQLLGLGRG